MPATGLNRRSWLLLLCGAALRGQENSSTLTLLTALASRLSDGNLPGALTAFSKTMPGYQNLVADLGALASQYDVNCVIEIREESGDEALRKADTEWFLQLRSKQEDGPTERRTVRVRITTERSGGKWRITALDPLSILSPPRVG